MELTIVIGEKPYLNDNAWNALSLAQTALDEGNQVNVVLSGDAACIARKDHSPDAGQPNLEAMISKLIADGADVRVGTTCIDTRPCMPLGEYSSCFIGNASKEMLGPQHLISGVRMETMADLQDWTQYAKTVSF